MPPRYEELGQPESREVIEGKWETLQGEGLIFTKGLQTCIGVAIYSPLDHRAFLGHLDHQAFTNGRFESMILAAMPAAKHPDAKIWVGGGVIIPKGHSLIRDVQGDPEMFEFLNTETEQHKLTTLRALGLFTRHGASLQMSWLERPGFVNYSLDVASGEDVIELSYSDES